MSKYVTMKYESFTRFFLILLHLLIAENQCIHRHMCGQLLIWYRCHVMQSIYVTCWLDGTK